MENVSQNSRVKKSNSQVSLSCRHCNGLKQLTVRCMICEFTLCEKCTVIHLQMPSAKGHTIIRFSDIPKYNDYVGLEKMKRKQEEKQREDVALLYLLKADFKLIRTVTTNLSAINVMASVSQDQAWICETDVNIISKINVKKNFLSKIFSSKQLDQIKGYPALDISVNTDGDLLFVCKSDKFIKIMKTNSQGQKQVCDLQDSLHLEPICIHCPKDGNNTMWIGLKEGGPDFKLGQESSRQVAEITETGEVCNIYEFTKANIKLFTLPCRIVSTTNAICVIDRLSLLKGRVISLKKSGHLGWIYTDPHPSLSKMSFLPTDLVVMSSMNAIICDSANNSLHILNEEGTLISRQYLINLKIEQPLSVYIDHDSSNLWIGTASDSFSKDKKAKMYELEMSGL